MFGQLRLYLITALIACETVSNGQSITAILDFSDSTKVRHYYRLANGREVGRDSVYVFDAIDDSESDGKIRFRDRVTDKVGYFDNTGRIVVPAVYSDASRFQNGMAMVIKNARRVGWHGEDCEKGDCEHWSWAGGSMMLINAQNEILVDSFNVDHYPTIDWYSMQLKDMPGDTGMYCSVKGVHGKWYVFVDSEKEFKKWFRDVYMEESGDVSNLRKYAHDSLVSSLPGHDDWQRMSGDEFIKKHGKDLSYRLQPLRGLKIDYFTSMEALNPYIHTGSSFEPYVDGIMWVDAGRYPVFDIISNLPDLNGKLGYQEHYSFLRTERGYKLIGVSWRDP